MTHVNDMKKFRWEGIQLCVIFVGKNVLIWESESFNGGWVVYHEEGRMSWCLDTSIHDTVDPCCYEFIVLSPRRHGAMMITRLCPVP